MNYSNGIFMKDSGSLIYKVSHDFGNDSLIQLEELRLEDNTFPLDRYRMASHKDGTLERVSKFYFDLSLSELEESNVLGPFYFSSLSAAEKGSAICWAKCKRHAEAEFNPIQRVSHLLEYSLEEVLFTYQLDLDKCMLNMDFAKENVNLLDGEGDFYYQLSFTTSTNEYTFSRLEISIVRVINIEFEPSLKDIYEHLHVYTFKPNSLSFNMESQDTVTLRGSHYESLNLFSKGFNFFHYLYLKETEIKTKEDLMDYISKVFYSKTEYTRKNFLKRKEKLGLYMKEKFFLSDINYTFFDNI